MSYLINQLSVVIITGLIFTLAGIVPLITNFFCLDSGIYLSTMPILNLLNLLVAGSRYIKWKKVPQVQCCVYNWGVNEIHNWSGYGHRLEEVCE